MKYDELKPFITKYFSPCQFILDKKQELLEKYNIDLKHHIEKIVIGIKAI